MVQNNMPARSKKIRRKFAENSPISNAQKAGIFQLWNFAWRAGKRWLVHEGGGCIVGGRCCVDTHCTRSKVFRPPLHVVFGSHFSLRGNRRISANFRRIFFERAGMLFWTIVDRSDKVWFKSDEKRLQTPQNDDKRAPPPPCSLPTLLCLFAKCLRTCFPVRVART